MAESLTNISDVSSWEPRYRLQRREDSTSDKVKKRRGPLFGRFFRRKYGKKHTQELERALSSMSQRYNSVLDALNQMIENNKYGRVIVNLENAQFGSNMNMSINHLSEDQGIQPVRNLLEKLTVMLDDHIEERTRCEAKLRKTEIMLSEIKCGMKECQTKLETSDEDNSKKLTVIRVMVSSLCCDRSDETVLSDCVSALKRRMNRGNETSDFESLEYSIQQGVSRLVNKYENSITWKQFAVKLRVKPERISTDYDSSRDKLNTAICLQILEQFVRGSPGSSDAHLAATLLDIIHTVDERHIAEQKDKYRTPQYMETQTNVKKTTETESSEEHLKTMGEVQIMLNQIQTLDVDNSKKLSVLREMVSSLCRDRSDKDVLCDCVSELKRMVNDGKDTSDFESLEYSIQQGVTRLVNKYGESFTSKQFAEALDVKPEELSTDNDSLLGMLNIDMCLQIVAQFVKDRSHYFDSSYDLACKLLSVRIYQDIDERKSKVQEANEDEVYDSDDNYQNNDDAYEDLQFNSSEKQKKTSEVRSKEDKILEELRNFREKQFKWNQAIAEKLDGTTKMVMSPRSRDSSPEIQPPRYSFKPFGSSN